MQDATMVYRAPGPHQLHGHDVDYQVIDGPDVTAALADGWFSTPTEAGEAYAAMLAEQAKTIPPAPVPPDDAPPTRAELEAKARELGIDFDGRTRDKRLGELIAQKLAA